MRSVASTDVTPFAVSTGVESAVTSVRFSPTGAVLAAAFWDGSVSLWDVPAALTASDSATAAVVPSQSTAPSTAAADKKKKRRRGGAGDDDDGAGAGAGAGAAAGSSTSAPVRSVVDMTPMQQLGAQSQCVAAVAWQGDSHVIAGGYDHCIRVFDVEEGIMTSSLVRSRLRFSVVVGGGGCAAAAAVFLIAVAVAVAVAVSCFYCCCCCPCRTSLN